MLLRFSIGGVLFFGLATAGAQVASHAPTVFPKTSAKSQPLSAPAQASKPVARVNGSVLTDADLVREEYSIFPYARQHNGGIPKDLAPQIRDGALKMIIFEELVYQEALRSKMTVAPAKMQAAKADFRKQFSAEEFNSIMQSEFHGSQQALEEKIRRSLLIEAFLNSEVETKSKVSPAEAKAFYDKSPTRFAHPESFTFQTISILPPPNANPEQLKEGHARAEKALRQAKATKSAEEFGLLAEKTSDDDYRVMMGQHKPVPAAELAPQVVKALLAMHPNDVSDVIPVEQAYTIVRLQEHTPAGRPKFDDVKAQIEKDLQQTKKNQIQAELDKRLRQGAKVEEL